jgi:hypothetical protein
MNSHKKKPIDMQSVFSKQLPSDLRLRVAARNYRGLLAVAVSRPAFFKELALKIRAIIDNVKI